MQYISCNQPPDSVDSVRSTKRRNESIRHTARADVPLRYFFFFRLLIVLFIIIIITHQSVENERLKKKKGKARDELTPLVTPYQCTVAHVRENT